MSQLRFSVNQDNRGGKVSAYIAGDGDANESSYNIDPGENQYAPISRQLQVRKGDENSILEVELNTHSEFLNYQAGECSGLRLKSAAVIHLPKQNGVQALGVAQDRIQMGLLLPTLPKGKPVRFMLRTKIDSDLEIVEIKFDGPSFSQPYGVTDTADEILEKVFTLTEPGEYQLTAAYQLALQLPNPGLGGREIKAEMFAELMALPSN